MQGPQLLLLQSWAHPAGCKLPCRPASASARSVLLFSGCQPRPAQAWFNLLACSLQQLEAT